MGKKESKYYTGVGAQVTPPHVQEMMYDMAQDLAADGWVLRSGAAEGADTAFENGVNQWANDHKRSASRHKQIFLPTKGFGGSTSTLYPPPHRAYEIAAAVHPAWYACSAFVRMLHARNVQQLLGPDPDIPIKSKFAVCWTKRGGVIGGTATAIRLAQMYKIPLINLGLGIKYLRVNGNPLPPGVRQIIRAAFERHHNKFKNIR